MALPAVAGNTIFASDLYGLCRPSGSSETGKYWLAGGTYANNANVSLYVVSISRAATPVSASFDTADFSASNLGTITQDHLTANGFHIWANGTGANTTAQAGGNYTISY